MAAKQEQQQLSYISFIVLLVLHFLSGEVNATTFTFINSCEQTVWPGILSNAGITPLSPTGFTLQPSESRIIITPETSSSSWGGRFWGRTYCSTNTTTGKFTCQTGDCGSGKIECSGSGATPPATLAEFTLNGSGAQDFYDVSLVDGYNLPMLVVPKGGSGVNCSTTGCVADLNEECPTELRVAAAGGGESVAACKSACEAFNQPQYCCSGAYGSPDTCQPSMYSMRFKKACPSAYSYAYDDKSSTFVCGGSPDYTITFCPTPSTSQKASSLSSGNQQQGTTPSGTATTSSGTSLQDSSNMVYMGAMDAISNAASTTSGGIGFLLAAAAAAAQWWLLLWML